LAKKILTFFQMFGLANRKAFELRYCVNRSGNKQAAESLSCDQGGRARRKFHMSLQQSATGAQPVSWQHWALVALAVILFISPFILGYGVGPQTYTAATSSMPDPGVKGIGGENNYFDPAMIAPVLGIIIGAVASLNVLRIPASQEWLLPILGLWVVVAPWVLGFASVAKLGTATTSWVVIGGLIFVISILAHPMVSGAKESS
jgi:hypothetical protein